VGSEWRFDIDTLDRWSRERARGSEPSEDQYYRRCRSRVIPSQPTLRLFDLGCSSEALAGCGGVEPPQMPQFAAIGEPWLLRFLLEELVAKLTDMGFAKGFHLSPHEADRRYFQNRSDGLSVALLEQMMGAIV
jgi:hypothetical protein